MRPRYRGREEVPVVEVKYAEADGRYYGSGRAVFDILSSPVTIRMPWRPAVGRPTAFLCAPDIKGASVALRKIDHAVVAKAAGQPQMSDAGDYPQVVEYLTAEVYPDGSKRQPSSLVVVSDGTSWRVCLSDRDNQRVMWKTGQTLQDALQAIELALMEDDPADWRRSAEAAGKRRK